MKNSITIKNIEVLAKHGVFDFEKETEQKFVFNILKYF